ncbi:hypothetical protein TNCV_3451971 [Trichonephila clavipes]|nr:hypothetical protein TNCV_3451971 [Trichonephila clavipes]
MKEGDENYGDVAKLCLTENPYEDCKLSNIECLKQHVKLQRNFQKDGFQRFLKVFLLQNKFVAAIKSLIWQTCSQHGHCRQHDQITHWKTGPLPERSLIQPHGNFRRMDSKDFSKFSCYNFTPNLSPPATNLANLLTSSTVIADSMIRLCTGMTGLDSKIPYTASWKFPEGWIPKISQNFLVTISHQICRRDKVTNLVLSVSIALAPTFLMDLFSTKETCLQIRKSIDPVFQKLDFFLQRPRNLPPPRKHPWQTVPEKPVLSESPSNRINTFA